MNPNRREFLKKSVAASATLAFLPSLQSCFTASESGIPDIGIQLYTLRNQMHADALGTLKKVAAIGYRKIETASYDKGKIYGFSAKEFKTILDDLGLDLVSGHVGYNAFAEEFDQVLETVVTAGQEYLVFPWLSPEMRTLDSYKAIAELLNKCGEKAKSVGVSVCYHNHDFEFQKTEGEIPMNVLTSELDPAYANIELDLYWINKAGLDAVRFFRDHTGRVPLWHVKDMANTPEQGFAEVGEGKIDFDAIFANANVSGMKHFFVEQDQSEDPLQSIKISFKNLSQNILV